MAINTLEPSPSYSEIWCWLSVIAGFLSVQPKIKPSSWQTPLTYTEILLICWKSFEAIYQQSHGLFSKIIFNDLESDSTTFLFQCFERMTWKLPDMYTHFYSVIEVIHFPKPTPVLCIHLVTCAFLYPRAMCHIKMQWKTCLSCVKWKRAIMKEIAWR